jgi:hypothetical protein
MHAYIFFVYAHKQSTALHTPLFTKHTVPEGNALQTSYRFSRKSCSKTAEGNSCVALKYIMAFTATIFPKLTNTQRMAVCISSAKLYPGLTNMCNIRKKFYLAFDQVCGLHCIYLYGTHICSKIIG